MLHKIRGIVLKTTTYSESSVIVHVFTDKFGLQSYLINGVKKPKAKIKMNILQPLHLLDMVVYAKAGGGLQRVSEARALPIYRTIPYDIVKSTIAIFLNEVLYKSIRQQDSDEQLFDFIFNAACWLDETPNASSNFHLCFLLKLTRFLGFAPSASPRTDHTYFDLQEGDFTSLLPVHANYLHREEADVFIALYATPFEEMHNINISTGLRRMLLDRILLYFRLHTASFGEVRSHLVLEEVLKE